MRIPIYINYDRQRPAGFVEIDDDLLTIELLADCAIVPAVHFDRVVPSTGERCAVDVQEFGLIARGVVDVRSIDEIRGALDAD